MWKCARVRCGSRRCTDAIGITMTGEKEVLSLWLAQTEGAKAVAYPSLAMLSNSSADGLSQSSPSAPLAKNSIIK
jgi:hypothetical protein